MKKQKKCFISQHYSLIAKELSRTVFFLYTLIQKHTYISTTICPWKRLQGNLMRIEDSIENRDGVTSAAWWCERTSRPGPFKLQVGQLYFNKGLPAQHTNTTETSCTETSEGGCIWAKRGWTERGKDRHRSLVQSYACSPADMIAVKGWGAIPTGQTRGAETAIRYGWLAHI